jgi:predicted TPR repeat methyltransferase
VPIDCTKNAFDVLQSGEYIAKEAVQKKLLETVQKGFYETSISDESDIKRTDIASKKYDFISANNVLQYVNKQQLESTIDRILGMLSDSGIVSLCTEEADTSNFVNQYMRGNKINFERIGKSRYKKIDNS